MDVMYTLWSYLNEKRVMCSNKLEKDIHKYIKKVLDIYVPSGSNLPFPPASKVAKLNLIQKR